MFEGADAETYGCAGRVSSRRAHVRTKANPPRGGDAKPGVSYPRSPSCQRGSRVLTVSRERAAPVGCSSPRSRSTAMLVPPRRRPPRPRGQRQLHAHRRGELRHLHGEPDDRAEGLDEGALLADARLRAVLRHAPVLVLEGVVLPERLRDLPRQRRRPRSIPSGSCATRPATSSTSPSPARAASARSTPPTSATPPSASGGSTRPARGSPRATPASTSMTSTSIARSPTARAGGRSDRPAHRRRDERADVAALPRRSHAGRPRRVPDGRDRPQLDLVRRRHHRRPAARPPRRQPDQPRARRQRRRPHRRHRQVELPEAAGLHRPSPGRGTRRRLRRHLDHRRRPPLRARRVLPDLLGPGRTRQRPGRHARRTGGRATTSTSARRSAPRYFWNGVLRRDFERGFTLVNEPGAVTRTLRSAPAPAI